MIQRLDELRRLLESRTMPCPDGYHAMSVRDDTLPCPTCCGSGRVPDPKWAPMLAVLRPRDMGALDERGRHIPLWVQADRYWDAAPEGALAGAMREAAWHAGIPRPVLDDAFAEIFGAASPNQAAVDWAIERLKAGRD